MSAGVRLEKNNFVLKKCTYLKKIFTQKNLILHTFKPHMKSLTQPFLQNLLVHRRGIFYKFSKIRKGNNPEKVYILSYTVKKNESRKPTALVFFYVTQAYKQ